MTENQESGQMKLEGWLVPDVGQELREVEVREIPLTALSEVLPGPEPTAEFIESVKRFHVVVPIVVVERPAVKSDPGGYDVVDGRRRVKAARAAGFGWVRARVYDAAQIPSQAVLTLILNHLRSSNPIAELEAIEALLVKGAGMLQICQATGMAQATVERLLKLQGVSKNVREAIRQGKIAVSVAEKLARLPDEPKARLEALLAEKGELHMPDIKAERHVQVRATTQALPGEAFGGPEEFDWRKELVSRLHEALKLVPAGDSIVGMLQGVIDAADG